MHASADDARVLKELRRRAWSSSLPTDRPVIGVIGRDVPRELIEAAGGVAWRLTGEPGQPTGIASAYLGRGVDPAATSLLARLLHTRFAGLHAIAVSADTEASRRLFYVLREMRRVAPDLHVPPVHLVDVLHEPTEASKKYSINRVEEFRTILLEWTRIEATHERLEEAARSADEVRALITHLDHRRRSDRGVVSGELFLAARIAGDRTPASEYAMLLRELLLLPAPTDGPELRLRLVLSGSTQDEPTVVRAIEAHGAAVVADDHGYGSVGLDGQSGLHGLPGIAERYWQDRLTPHRSRATDRARQTVNLANDSLADGVLVYVRRRDESALWDAAFLQRASPVPVAIIRDQEYGEVDPDALTRSIAMIRGGQGG